jgi:hypothetical protein
LPHLWQLEKTLELMICAKFALLAYLFAAIGVVASDFFSEFRKIHMSMMGKHTCCNMLTSLGMLGPNLQTIASLLHLSESLVSSILK